MSMVGGRPLVAEYPAWFGKNSSFQLNLKILVRTGWSVLRSENVRGRRWFPGPPEWESPLHLAQLGSSSLISRWCKLC
jgi:lipopolysaccharide/colanic/teichoic acid biosynthesis glycosyltransferase